MLKIGALGLILLCVMTTLSFAQESSLDWEARYILNRGVVGLAYKACTGVFKAVEYVLFGRYGIRGIADYCKVNRIFQERTPKY